MIAAISWKRVFLATTAFLGAVTVAQPDQAQLVQPLTIYGHFKGRIVMLTATGRSAGAIESLQWGAMEFLDASDNGRHLQSAISFDNLGECDNPTEAGSSSDGTGPRTSSSRLLAASVANNELKTYSQMAYWFRIGDRRRTCGEVKNDGNLTSLSSTNLAKTVRFLPGLDNVLEHKISFDLARPRSYSVLEVLTAYMPAQFDTFHRFNPATGDMEPLSDGPGEQELPVVLATSDATHALGLFTPQATRGQLQGPGYGRFRFENAGVTKSNVVFRLRDARAGRHSFLVYSVFGTLDDVRATLSRLHRNGPSPVAESSPVQSDVQASVRTLAKN
jgi:hypothetical protein